MTTIELLSILGRACVYRSLSKCVQVSVIMGVPPKVLNKKMKDIAAPEEILHRGRMEKDRQSRNNFH